MTQKPIYRLPVYGTICLVSQICSHFCTKKRRVLAKPVKISVFVQAFWTFNGQATRTAQQFLPACCISALQILMANALIKSTAVCSKSYREGVPASHPRGRDGSAIQATRDCYPPPSLLLFLIFQEFTHSSPRFSLTAWLYGRCHSNLVGLSSFPPWQRAARLPAPTSC